MEELYQDSDGNLWVGLPDYLLRVRDGGIVEQYAEREQDAGASAVFEDREHNLWLGSSWNGATRLWNGWTRR